MTNPDCTCPECVCKRYVVAASTIRAYPSLDPHLCLSCNSGRHSTRARVRRYAPHLTGDKGRSYTVGYDGT